MSGISIQVEHLGKCFRFYENKWRRLAGLIAGVSDHASETWAVRDLNFSLEQGSTLGVIGANGSGKTTLLQLLAGLLQPTEGRVHVRGNLATLLELGSGLSQDLTGRENVFVSGGLRGFSRRDVAAKMEEIVRFAELEEFIDHPIKHYSAGMHMRLSFAVAINVEPDVLLIDEVFSVGDMAFQHKCTRKFRELQKKGVTTVLVTHDIAAVRSLCNHALLLDHGSQVVFGSPEEVTNRYLDLTAQKIARQEMSQEIRGEEPGPPSIQGEFLTEIPGSKKMYRHGSGQAKIRGLQVLNSKGLPTQLIAFGEEVTFRFYVEYLEDVPESGIGFYIRDLYGIEIVGVNTFEENKSFGSRKKGDRLIVDFRLPLYLRAGSYSVSPGLAIHPTEPRYLDWIDNAAVFEMEKPVSGMNIYGLTYIPNSITVQLLK
jgi:ABC-type polysaccharide/polyol phosphate transport system ATPase subunit